MKPVFRLDQIIGQLNSGNVWSTTNVTYSFPTTLSPDHAGEPEISGFSTLTSAQRAAATAAIRAHAEITTLDFTLVADNAGDIRLHNVSGVDGYAFAYLPNVGTGWGGDVFFNSDYDNRDTNDLVHPVRGQHGYSTYLHELGHALGLNHPGNYNAGSGGAITYADDAVYRQDSTQYTVMSYFTAAETGADHSYDGVTVEAAETLLLHDIAALQAMYGADPLTRNATTVYGFNSTVAGDTPYDFEANRDPVLCIYDAGGSDTLDFSGFTSSTVLDLRPGAFSNTQFMTKNVSIAIGTIIERGIGGSGADLIRGNSVDNVLRGGNGGDRLFGMAGNDTLSGGNSAGSGIEFGSGLYLDTSAANNRRAAAVDISDLFSLKRDPDIGNSTTVPHVQIRNTYTAAARDFFKVSIANAGTIITLDIDYGNLWARSSDTQVQLLDSRGRVVASNDDADVVDRGSTGILDSFLSFAVKAAGIYTIAVGRVGNVPFSVGRNYELQVSVDGETQPDERLDGGTGDDILNGDGGSDILLGGAGNDSLRGGSGDDLFVLADGSDTVSDISGRDTISSTITRTLGSYGSIENLLLLGSAAIDGTGNARGNSLTGNSGANTLNGGAGHDALEGGRGADILTGGAHDDRFVYKSAAQSSGSATDTITDFDDSGNDAIDFSLLFSGVLLYRGGAGFDGRGQVRVVASGSDVRVLVNLDADTAAELSILLDATSIASMTASDFIL